MTGSTKRHPPIDDDYDYSAPRVRNRQPPPEPPDPQSERPEHSCLYSWRWTLFAVLIFLLLVVLGIIAYYALVLDEAEQFQSEGAHLNVVQRNVVHKVEGGMSGRERLKYKRDNLKKKTVRVKQDVKKVGQWPMWFMLPLMVLGMSIPAIMPGAASPFVTGRRLVEHVKAHLTWTHLDTFFTLTLFAIAAGISAWSHHRRCRLAQIRKCWIRSRLVSFRGMTILP